MLNNNPPPNPNDPSPNPFGGGFSPAYQQPYTPAPAKKSFFTPMRLLLGCGVLALVCVAVFGIIFVFTTSAIQPAKDKGDEFMEALKRSDYEAAYAMGDSEFQEAVGSAEALREVAEANNAIPDKWSFDTGGSIETNTNSTTASLTGSVTYQDGSEHDLEMELVKIDDEWHIRYFSFE